MSLIVPRLPRPPVALTPAPPPGLRIAHRGGLLHAPENSLAAIREAARLGVDAVELDVRERDRALVCAHDAHQDGPPTRDALALALDLGLRVELDLKSHGGDDAVQRVAELIDVEGAHARTWVSTFQPLAAWRLRHVDPRLVVGWSVSPSRLAPLPMWTSWLRWLGVQVIEPERSLVTPERLAHWRELGLVVETWCVPPEDQHDWLARDVSVVLDDLRT